MKHTPWTITPDSEAKKPITHVYNDTVNILIKAAITQTIFN